MGNRPPSQCATSTTSPTRCLIAQRTPAHSPLLHHGLQSSAGSLGTTRGWIGFGLSVATVMSGGLCLILMQVGGGPECRAAAAGGGAAGAQLVLNLKCSSIMHSAFCDHCGGIRGSLLTTPSCVFNGPSSLPPRRPRATWASQSRSCSTGTCQPPACCSPPSPCRSTAPTGASWRRIGAQPTGWCSPCLDLWCLWASPLPCR